MPRAVRHVGLCAIAALLCTFASRPVDTAPDEFSTTSLVKVLSAYVANYQQQLAFVVADERTTQTVTRGGIVQATRITSGELFVTYLAAEQTWANVHDVAEVDGTPVPDRDDLRALLRESSMLRVGRDLAARNARFNIGAVGRNFNEPLFALLAVNERRISGFSFSVERVDKSAPGGAVATLAFRERERPTLVTTPRGAPAFSRGTFVIEAATGRVRAMHVGLTDEVVRADLETTFEPNATLGLWVPASFTERYMNLKGSREETSCASTYSNYRRFETRSRIK